MEISSQIFFDCHHICNAIETIIVKRYVSALPSPQLGDHGF